MDTRLTVSGNSGFYDLLQNLFRSGEKVNLLVDDKGMTRAEGIINGIHPDSEVPFMELDNGMKIDLNMIIAVNGVFLPEYSEC